MKVALCISGIVGKVSNRTSGGESGSGGSSGSDIDPAIGHSFWKYALLDHFDVDVFIHAWCPEHENLIRSLYDPKKATFQEQIKFHPAGDDWLDDYDHPLKTKEDLRKDRRYKPSLDAFGDGVFDDLRHHAERSRSTLYGRKMAVDLKRKFEEENDFEYDIVIMGRFDLWFRNRFPLEKLTRFDEGFIYGSPRTNGSVIREDWDYAMQDIFFLGDTKTMDTFSLLYDHITDYAIPNPMSAYEHVDKFIGIEKWHHLWRFLDDYNLLRWVYPEDQLALK